MAEYHSGHPENVVAYLHHLVKNGINTIQARGDYHRVLHWIELFRREGGDIQWITQTATVTLHPARPVPRPAAW